MKTLLAGLLIAATVGYTTYPHNPQPTGVLQNTVKLFGAGDSGSGTVIGTVKYGFGATHSLIITCAHVVEKATHMQVLHDDKTYDGTVVAIDKKRDLALIEVNEHWHTASLFEGKTTAGERELVAGAPLNESPVLTDGYLAGHTPEGWQGSAVAWPGNSGGGMYVNRNGWKLAGVLQSIRVARVGFSYQLAPSVSFYVPMTDVQAFLAEHHFR